MLIFVPLINKITAMTTISKISLGKNGPLVSKLGLGCMRMSPVWGGPANDESESIATIQQALDSGINFLNTGDFYGSGHNELLVGKAIKGTRNDAFLSVKFGGIIHGGKFLGLDRLLRGAPRLGNIAQDHGVPDHLLHHHSRAFASHWSIEA